MKLNGVEVANSDAPGEIYACLGSEVILSVEGGVDFDVCISDADECAFKLMYVYQAYSWEAPTHLGTALPGGREFKLQPTQVGTYNIVWWSREGKFGPSPPAGSGLPEPCSSVGNEDMSITLTVQVREACKTWELAGALLQERLNEEVAWGPTRKNGGPCDPPTSWASGTRRIWPRSPDRPDPLPGNVCDEATIDCEGNLVYRANGELVGRCIFPGGRNNFWIKPLKSACGHDRLGAVAHVVQSPGVCGGRYKFRVSVLNLTREPNTFISKSVYSPIPSVNSVDMSINPDFDVDTLLRQPAIVDKEEQQSPCTEPVTEGES